MPRASFYLRKGNDMKLSKDTYGKEILAYYNGKRDAECIDRDDGFTDNTKGFVSNYFAVFNKWPAHEKNAMKLVRGRVLDIGCGAGRHCLYLQEKGFDITGIDNSPKAIEVCRARGVNKAIVRPIESTGKFKPGSFDTIIMMGNNFGLMGSFRKARRLLKVFYGITSPGGQIIAETTDPYKTDYKPHLDYQAWNRKRGRMSGQLKIRVRFGNTVGPWFDYLFVSRPELKEILIGTKWKVAKLINTKGPKYIMVLGKIK